MEESNSIYHRPVGVEGVERGSLPHLAIIYCKTCPTVTKWNRCSVLERSVLELVLHWRELFQRLMNNYIF